MYEDLELFWQYYDESLPLNVMMTGISYCDKTYRVERRPSDILSFEYIIKGKGVLQIDGQTLYPQTNDVYILKEGDFHQYYSSEEEPWVKIWVIFQGPLAKTMMREYIPKDVYLVHGCNLFMYLQEILDLAKQYKTEYQKFTDQAGILILHMMQSLHNQITNKKLTLPEQIKSLLDAKIEDRIRLDEIADQLHYSVNHLIQCFGQEYHMTPYQYFMRKKIETAKHYLVNSNLTISEIAALLHFADAHYFTNCFKQMIQITPSQYRKNQRVSDLNGKKY